MPPTRTVVRMNIAFCTGRNRFKSLLFISAARFSSAFYLECVQQGYASVFSSAFLPTKRMAVKTRQGRMQSKATSVVPLVMTSDDDPGIPSSPPSSPTNKRRTRNSTVAAAVVSPEPAQVLSSEPKKKRVKKTPASPKANGKNTTRKAPKDWQEIYSIVEEMRQDRTAPCDSMGCEALAALDNGDAPGFRFQALVALLLSSQTKDAAVSEAVQLMKKDNILSVTALLEPNITQELLANKYLAKVGFRNNKAKYLKQVVEILHRDYNDDIPPTADKMIDELPGIGPKMAYICEAVAWDPDTPSGIGVDTHMHRLFNMLGWVKSKTPEQTRLQLEAWLPLEKWKTVNLLWVGFGQQVQQQKETALKQALATSQPEKALRLLKRCGIDLKKEGDKYGLTDAIQAALKSNNKLESAT